MIDDETYKKLAEEREAAAEKCRLACWEYQKAYMDLPVEPIEFEPVTNSVGLTMTGVDPEKVQIDINAERSTVNIKMTMRGAS
jgi:hypothetical protein